MKTIYGMETSYRDCLQKSGLQTLADRREELLKKFAERSYNSERFREKWYPPKEKSGYGLRREQAVREEFASRDRLLNAPIYRLRKYINAKN